MYSLSFGGWGQARTGWVKRDVAKFESVADHSWRMGVLPLLLQEHEGLDHVRCMKVSLCLTRVGRLSSSWHAGCEVHVRQLRGGQEPELTILLSPSTESEPESASVALRFRFKVLLFKEIIT